MVARPSAWKKHCLREITGSIGRYIAIFAIVALGVGFFSGLKITRKAMITAGDTYISGCNMYDFRLISTLGFTEEDLAAFSEAEGVISAEGGFRTDSVASVGGGKDTVVTVLPAGSKVNIPSLVAGRMPADASECLLDANRYGSEYIGATVVLKDCNGIEATELTAVGTANSVLYLNVERGTTTLGDGKVGSFLLVLPEAFTLDYYTEIYLDTDTQGALFSDEYKSGIDSAAGTMSDILSARADIRYSSIVSDAEEQLEAACTEYEALLEDYNSSYKETYDYLDSVKLGLDSVYGGEDNAPEAYAEYNAALEKANAEFAEAKAAIDEAAAEIENARTDIGAIARPSVYCLGRDSNTGYVCFDSDSSVVDGIARVFPLFFFMVAALVCVTTMARMVEEQRTEIGTLKALGYGNGIIALKYVGYSGSAAVLGCAAGYFVGTALFPRAIWEAYGILYGFSDIAYVFDLSLALVSLFFSLLCSAGATWAACRATLTELPASLMRPRAPKPGKRVLLEHIGFIWNRLGFFGKVSARNILRYKKRLLMMVLGISGCTALVLTGFGIRDSISNIAEDQYEGIMHYDYIVEFDGPVSYDMQHAFVSGASELLADTVFVRTSSAEAAASSGVVSVNVVATDDSSVTDLITFASGDKTVPYPFAGGVIINTKLASRCGVSVGDEITLRSGDSECSFAVTGIFDNYVYDYVFMNMSSCVELYGDETGCSTAFATAVDSADIHSAAAALINDHGASSVTVIQDLCDRVANMMKSLNYIVWLVIFCAAALALVVIFNLSNINITEREREIATIKVLGFNSAETGAYVFRENIVLTLTGAAVGLPLGIILHRFVMSNINIDMVSFNVRILPVSFLYAFLITVSLDIFADLLMRRKLASIDMAESLKSVE